MVRAPADKLGGGGRGGRAYNSTPKRPSKPSSGAPSVLCYFINMKRSVRSHWLLSLWEQVVTPAEASTT